MIIVKQKNNHRKAKKIKEISQKVSPRKNNSLLSFLPQLFYASQCISTNG